VKPTTRPLELFANGVSQGVRSSSPFRLHAKLDGSTYTITALSPPYLSMGGRKPDGQSAQTTSASRRSSYQTTNNRPTVALTSPTAKANYRLRGLLESSITPSTTDGEITARSESRVLRQRHLKRHQGSGPWNFTWTTVAAGTYS